MIWESYGIIKSTFSAIYGMPENTNISHTILFWSVLMLQTLTMINICYKMIIKALIHVHVQHQKCLI